MKISHRTSQHLFLDKTKAMADASRTLRGSAGPMYKSKKADAKRQKSPECVTLPLPSPLTFLRS